MWYYSKAGAQQDPVSEQELIQKIQSGEILAADLVWKEGMASWQAVSQTPELSGGAAVSAAPASAPLSSPAPPSSAAWNPNAQTQLTKVPNYLWQSIVASLLCCTAPSPFALVAIVYAAKVDMLVAHGDIVGAQAASKSAKTWVGVSVGCSLLLFIAWFLLVVVFGTSASEL